MVERCPDKTEVKGPIPFGPTIKAEKLMLKVDRFFITVILASFIIGGFVYLSKDTSAPLLKQSLEAGSVQSKSSALQTNACGAADNVVVTKIIDGDTVVVQGGHHVRLLGIDADEKDYACYNAAKNRLEELVLGKKVALVKDATDVDQYGRCLRYLFLNQENISTQLVKEGQAVASFYQADVTYKSEIANAEKYAIDNNIGCKWSNN